jgi:murein L,D-transpeptidase YcbB/YkuD
MKKSDKLLRQIESFEKLALYGDKKDFLSALGQLDNKETILSHKVPDIMPTAKIPDEFKNAWYYLDRAKKIVKQYSEEHASMGFSTLQQYPDKTQQVIKGLEYTLKLIYNMKDQSLSAQKSQLISQLNAALTSVKPVLDAAKEYQVAQESQEYTPVKEVDKIPIPKAGPPKWTAPNDEGPPLTANKFEKLLNKYAQWLAPVMTENGIIGGTKEEKEKMMRERTTHKLEEPYNHGKMMSHLNDVKNEVLSKVPPTIHSTAPSSANYISEWTPAQRALLNSYYGYVPTVKKFQTDHGLKIDGLIGKQTSSKLYSLSGSKYLEPTTSTIQAVEKPLQPMVQNPIDKTWTAPTAPVTTASVANKFEKLLNKYSK